MSLKITDRVLSTENELSAKIINLSAKAEADITKTSEECDKSHQMSLESMANLQKNLSELEKTSKGSVFKDSKFSILSLKLRGKKGHLFFIKNQPQNRRNR